MKVKDHYIVQCVDGFHDLYITSCGQYLFSNFQWLPGGGGLLRNLKLIGREEAEEMLKNAPGNDPAKP